MMGRGPQGGYNQNQQGPPGQYGRGQGPQGTPQSPKFLWIIVVILLVVGIRFGLFSEIRSQIGGTFSVFLVVGIVIAMLAGGGRRRRGGGGGGYNQNQNQGGYNQNHNQGGYRQNNRRW